MFELHPRLAADTVLLADLPLSRALVMGDARYPWVILVPRRADLREIHDLARAERGRLMEEIAALSEALERECRPDKINVGALGNLVPQLHIHVIARFVGDPAWPGPVWGQGTAEPYGPGKLEALKARLIPHLEDSGDSNDNP